ncbi:MAG: right-handed parallel beta-helix repeat-containing protein [Clostridia bacterium]|nr:right-handed parallel beta-helix repeat-containing protein [Clostridia bacterium]
MFFSILQYGAKTDGSLCTKAIQAAIDACFLAGGGEVTVPEGRFRTGGLRLRSNVTLHLLENAVLEGSRDPEDYMGFWNDSIEPIPENAATIKVESAHDDANGDSVFPYSRWNNALIRAIDAENIAIIGEKGSEINGMNCYDPQGEENYRGPHPINCWFCENITLKGYTIRDGGNWGHAIQNSQHIHISNVTVLGGHDGFDVRTCDDVMVENCVFDTGDDCIAGFDNLNVTVRNCTMASGCSIFRFGGTDVLIENCDCSFSRFACRGGLPLEKKIAGELCLSNPESAEAITAFLYYCDRRAKIRKTPGNILVRNCRFERMKKLFNMPFGHRWTCNRSLADITFENCIFDGVRMPITSSSDPETPFNLCIKDSTVIAREGSEEIAFADMQDCNELILENVTLKNFDDPRVRCPKDCKIMTNQTSPLRVERAE